MEALSGLKVASDFFRFVKLDNLSKRELQYRQCVSNFNQVQLQHRLTKIQYHDIVDNIEDRFNFEQYLSPQLKQHNQTLAFLKNIVQKSQKKILKLSKNVELRRKTHYAINQQIVQEKSNWIDLKRQQRYQTVADIKSSNLTFSQNKMSRVFSISNHLQKSSEQISKLAMSGPIRDSSKKLFLNAKLGNQQSDLRQRIVSLQQKQLKQCNSRCKRLFSRQINFKTTLQMQIDKQNKRLIQPRELSEMKLPTLLDQKPSSHQATRKSQFMESKQTFKQISSQKLLQIILSHRKKNQILSSIGRTLPLCDKILGDKQRQGNFDRWKKNSRVLRL